MEKQETIEQLRIKIKNQFIYDYLKENYSVIVDKIINQFALRNPSDATSFIPFEQIILLEDLELQAGSATIKDIFRYFANEDFSDILAFVASLSDEEVSWIISLMDVFRYPQAMSTNNFRLSTAIQIALNAYRTNEKYYINADEVFLERTKPCGN